MARTKGSKNKDLNIRPETSTLTTEARLQLVANLIVDRIMHDKDDEIILKKVRGSLNAKQLDT